MHLNKNNTPVDIDQKKEKIAVHLSDSNTHNKYCVGLQSFHCVI